MRETSKATVRRLKDPTLNWGGIFVGHGCDVGCGDDPLNAKDWPNISKLELFDEAQGDANYLSTYFPKGTFDFIHGSQVLEHMHNPVEAVKDWLKALKSGGHLVVTVPDFYIYEHANWPSKYNSDHKSMWSITRPKSACPNHQWMQPTPWLETSGINLLADWMIEPRLVDTNYDYTLPFGTDQTYEFSDMVECWIEFILRKK